jgi:hypothetical protein
MNNRDVYINAINAYGTEEQVRMIYEEMCELGVALSKHHRDPGMETVRDVQEEIADVQIMLEQAKEMFGRSGVEWIIQEKTERLRKRVEEKLEAANKKKKFKLDDYRGNYAMHCSTNKMAETFLKFLHKHGKSWRTGGSYLEETSFECYRNDTCYLFNEGMYGELKCVEEDKYNILEFDDFDWSDGNE